ncbi:MAG: hypothetical protein DMG09_01620 [Acidobacteria bacterium]|nr:MAG: hypothetical protein DMG09_01620 [Acidobacteriota bacterium]
MTLRIYMVKFPSRGMNDRKRNETADERRFTRMNRRKSASIGAHRRFLPAGRYGASSLFLAAFLTPGASCASSAQPLPQRIISVSPNVTEILYGIGAFDRVVAVSDYCTYPPAVQNRPRVGGWENSNLEKIAALRPDLVILTDAQAPFLEDKLRDLGIRSVAVPTRSLADIFVSIDEIGRATGTQARAADLARRTRASLDNTRALTRNLPRPSVLFVVDRTPGTLRDMTVAAQGSFLADLIDIAGGRITAAPAKSGYLNVSKDAILTLDPEVIIDLVHWSKGRFAEHPELVWHDLPELRAVREGRLCPLRDEFLPHASQFVADTAKLLAKLIHPEAFGGGTK